MVESPTLRDTRTTAPLPHGRAWSRWLWTVQWAPAAALGVFMLAAVRAGLPPNVALRGLLVIALTQILPGMLVWRSIRGKQGWWIEDVVGGFAVGACVAIAAQTAAGTLQLPWLSWAPGVAVAGVIIALPGLRTRVMSVPTDRLPPSWSLSVAGAALLLLIPTQRFYRLVPLSWPEGFRATSVDVPFHLAITGQLAHRGPTSMPHVAGEPLLYHWFSHAWVAQISSAGGGPLDAILLRLGPPLIAVLLAVAIAIVAVRLSGRVWAGPVASLVAVASIDVNILGRLVPGTRGVLLTPSALSLGFSSILLVALVSLLVLRWRGEGRSGSSAIVVLLAFGAVGSKGSALSVLVAGVGLAFVVAWLSRWPARLAISRDLVLLLGTLYLALSTVFGGGRGGVSLDPGRALTEAGVSKVILEGVDELGPPLLVVAAGLVLISVLARGAGLCGALTVPRLRHDPAVPLLGGVALAGAAAVVLLMAGGKSQYYFLRNAIPVMGIASAVGFSGLWEGLGTARAAVLKAAALVGLAVLVIEAYGFRAVTTEAEGLARVALLRTLFVATVLAAGVALVARSRAGRATRKTTIAVAIVSVALVSNSVVPGLMNQFRNPLPAYNAPIEPTDRFGFSRDQIDAARWLRDHSELGDVVMTNRHCTSPNWVNCDSRRFSVAAYTERQVLLEGWAYTRSWARSHGDRARSVYREFWDEDLQLLNDGFIEAPEPATRDALYDLGVRWVFVDKTVAYSDRLADYAELGVETAWAAVYEFQPPPN